MTYKKYIEKFSHISLHVFQKLEDFSLLIKACDNLIILAFEIFFFEIPFINQHIKRIILFFHIDVNQFIKEYFYTKKKNSNKKDFPPELAD